MYLILEICIKWIKILVVVFEWGWIKVEEIFLFSLRVFVDLDNFLFLGGGGWFEVYLWWFFIVC